VSSVILLTKAGFEGLSSQIKALEEERTKIIQKIDEARKLGDLSENAEYKAAREDQRINDKKLSDLSIIKANAQVITKQMIGDETTIKIGASVKLASTEGGADKIVMIVSNYESSVEKGFVSIETPIAQKLLGKAIGDEILLGSKTYEIASISYKHI